MWRATSRNACPTACCGRNPGLSLMRQLYDAFCDTLKKWNLSALSIPESACYISPAVCRTPAARIGAGWSSPVARQAHNLKVVGSNPTPATKLTPSSQRLGGVLLLQSRLKNERSINPNDSRYLRGRRVRELRAPIAQTSPQTPRPLA